MILPGFIYIERALGVVVAVFFLAERIGLYTCLLEILFA